MIDEDFRFTFGLPLVDPRWARAHASRTIVVSLPYRIDNKGSGDPSPIVFVHTIPQQPQEADRAPTLRPTMQSAMKRLSRSFKPLLGLTGSKRSSMIGVQMASGESQDQTQSPESVPKIAVIPPLEDMHVFMDEDSLGNLVRCTAVSSTPVDGGG